MTFCSQQWLWMFCWNVRCSVSAATRRTRRTRPPQSGRTTTRRPRTQATTPTGGRTPSPKTCPKAWEWGRCTTMKARSRTSSPSEQVSMTPADSSRDCKVTGHTWVQFEIIMFSIKCTCKMFTVKIFNLFFLQHPLLTTKARFTFSRLCSGNQHSYNGSQQKSRSSVTRLTETVNLLKDISVWSIRFAYTSWDDINTEELRRRTAWWQLFCYLWTEPG